MPQRPSPNDNEWSLLKKLVANTAEMANSAGVQISGEVATFANLPAASSSTNLLYLVRAGSGIPFINRNPAGLYQSDGASWMLLADLPDGYFTGYVPDTRTVNGLPLSSDITIPTGTIPAGLIAMWGGLVADIPSGWNLCDGTNGTPDLRDKFIKGAAAGQDPGATGGSATHTPTGTVSQPTFAGDENTTSSDSAGTPSGAVSAPVFTGNSNSTNAVSGGTPAGTLDSVSAGTPAGTLDSVSAGTPSGSNANESAHTHGVTSNVAVADHAAHTHQVTAAGTNSAPTFTGNAVAAASTNNTPDLVTSNTGGTGVSPVTTATGTVSAPTFTGSAVTSGNPSATLTHSVTNNAVTSGAGSAHTHAFTGSALAGHAHTFTGTALGTHTHIFTGSALGTHSHTVTPTGTNSAPNFTGDALSGHDHTLTPTGTVSQPTFTGDDASYEPEYYSLCFIQKAA